MPSPEGPSQQPIEDIDAAREAAYAEKPARDYIAEYKGHLSDEARQSLEWVASQEGEKALKRYEETKNEEDPVVRILRERALESIEFPEKVRAELAKHEPDHRIGEVPQKQWIAGCEWALRDLGAELINGTISDEHMNLSKKAEALERLSPHLQMGIDYAPKGVVTLEARDPARHDVDTGWGVFIGNLMANKGIKTIEFLQQNVNVPSKSA